MTPIRSITAQKPIPEVVSVLRDMLERAERGELRMVAGVAVMAGGEDVISFRSHAEGRVFALLGALRVLEHKLLERVE